MATIHHQPVIDVANFLLGPGSPKANAELF